MSSREDECDTVNGCAWVDSGRPRVSAGINLTLSGVFVCGTFNSLHSFFRWRIWPVFTPLRSLPRVHTRPADTGQPSRSIVTASYTHRREYNASSHLYKLPRHAQSKPSTCADLKRTKRVSGIPRAGTAKPRSEPEVDDSSDPIHNAMHPRVRQSLLRYRYSPPDRRM